MNNKHRFILGVSDFILISPYEDVYIWSQSKMEISRITSEATYNKAKHILLLQSNKDKLVKYKLFMDPPLLAQFLVGSQCSLVRECNGRLSFLLISFFFFCKFIPPAWSTVSSLNGVVSPVKCKSNLVRLFSFSPNKLNPFFCRV